MVPTLYGFILMPDNIQFLIYLSGLRTVMSIGLHFCDLNFLSLRDIVDGYKYQPHSFTLSPAMPP